MSSFGNCVHKEVLKEEGQQRRIHWSETPQGGGGGERGGGGEVER